jgi:hypothetical protein
LLWLIGSLGYLRRCGITLGSRLKLALDEPEKVQEHIVLGSELRLQGLDVVVTHCVSLREELVDMLVLGVQERLVGLHGLGRGIKESLVVGQQVGVFAMSSSRWWC